MNKNNRWKRHIQEKCVLDYLKKKTTINCRANAKNNRKINTFDLFLYVQNTKKKIKNLPFNAVHHNCQNNLEIHFHSSALFIEIFLQKFRECLRSIRIEENCVFKKAPKWHMFFTHNKISRIRNSVE